MAPNLSLINHMRIRRGEGPGGGCSVVIIGGGWGAVVTVGKGSIVACLWGLGVVVVVV